MFDAILADPFGVPPLWPPYLPPPWVGWYASLYLLALPWVLAALAPDPDDIDP